MSKSNLEETFLRFLPSGLAKILRNLWRSFNTVRLWDLFNTGLMSHFRSRSSLSGSSVGWGCSGPSLLNSSSISRWSIESIGRSGCHSSLTVSLSRVDFRIASRWLIGYAVMSGVRRPVLPPFFGQSYAEVVALKGIQKLKADCLLSVHCKWME